MDAGDWIVFRDYGVRLGVVEKVTPKLVKIKPSGDWPTRQITRDKVLIATADQRVAGLVRHTIDGIEAEFAKHRNAADLERNQRVLTARAERDAKIKIIVEGISEEQSK